MKINKLTLNRQQFMEKGLFAHMKLESTEKYVPHDALFVPFTIIHIHITHEKRGYVVIKLHDVTT